MNKKYLIIGVVVAIIVIYYLLTKKKGTGNLTQDAIDGNTANLGSLIGANKKAVRRFAVSLLLFLFIIFQKQKISTV